MSCPIPADIHVQKYWKDHNIITDEMVSWIKTQAGCTQHEGIREVDEELHFQITGESISSGRLAWMKIDRREGVLNVYEEQLFYSDLNGRNISEYN